MTGLSRVVAGAATPLAGALALHAAPALTARGPLRRGLPRLTGQGRPGGVALTFDDGPDPLGTPAVLAELTRLRWTATFFLLGEQVRRHPQVARSVLAAGHEIGVHGDRHCNHLGRSPGWVLQDLRRACAAVSDATGVRPRWFRPPFGVLAAASLYAAGQLDVTPVLWTAWGRDWGGIPSAQVLAHLTRGLADGGTILLHDSDCTSAPGSWRSTTGVLPLLAAELDRRHLEVRPLRAHLVRAG